MPNPSKQRAIRAEVYRAKYSGEIYEIHDTDLARFLRAMEDEITRLRAELDRMRKELRERPLGP